jgi:dimethylglycine dehydrogenase
MAYLDRAVIADGAELDVHIVGVKRRAGIIAASPIDPSGARMRA